MNQTTEQLETDSDYSEPQVESLLRVTTFMQSGLGVDPGADIDDDGQRPRRKWKTERGRRGMITTEVTWEGTGGRRGLKFEIDSDGKTTLVAIIGDHGDHHPHKIAMLYGNALCCYVPQKITELPA